MRDISGDFYSSLWCPFFRLGDFEMDFPVVLSKSLWNGLFWSIWSWMGWISRCDDCEDGMSTFILSLSWLLRPIKARGQTNPVGLPKGRGRSYGLFNTKSETGETIPISTLIHFHSKEGILFEFPTSLKRKMYLSRKMLRVNISFRDGCIC